MSESDLDRILIGGREGGRVRLVPYRPEWALRFERERVATALEGAGYVLRVDEGSEHRMFRTPERDVHVHLWVPHRTSRASRAASAPAVIAPA